MENSLHENSGSANGKCVRTDFDSLSTASLSTVRTSDVGSYMEISRESFGLKTTPQQPAQCSNYSGGSTQLSSPSMETGETGRLGEMRYTESRVIPHGESGGGEGARGFPWVQLTDNDRSILLTTHR